MIRYVSTVVKYYSVFLKCFRGDKYSKYFDVVGGGHALLCGKHKTT